MEKVILVDKNDNQIGELEKMKAHLEAKLHRAFSIFIFNNKNELMLQKRALTKYHTPGLWTNTCCSHPRPGEKTIDAAHRRLQEEMGFDCDLIEVYVFTYEAKFSDLTEHEIDHVFVGKYNNKPIINPEEVDSYKWINLTKLEHDVKINPDNYTPWFKIILKEYLINNINS